MAARRRQAGGGTEPEPPLVRHGKDTSERGEESTLEPSELSGEMRALELSYTRLPEYAAAAFEDDGADPHRDDGNRYLNDRRGRLTASAPEKARPLPRVPSARGSPDDSNESPVDEVKTKKSVRKSRGAKSSGSSTHFSNDDGGLIVGFGTRRRQRSEPSEASSIGSSETSGTPSGGSSSSSSGGSFSSGSDGSSTGMSSSAGSGSASSGRAAAARRARPSPR